MLPLLTLLLLLLMLLMLLMLHPLLLRLILALAQKKAITAVRLATAPIECNTKHGIPYTQGTTVQTVWILQGLKAGLVGQLNVTPAS